MKRSRLEMSTGRLARPVWDGPTGLSFLEISPERAKTGRNRANNFIKIYLKLRNFIDLGNKLINKCIVI